MSKDPSLVIYREVAVALSRAWQHSVISEALSLEVGDIERWVREHHIRSSRGHH